DAAIMALPFPETGLMVRPLYDEPFVVALPAGHPWEKRDEIDAEDNQSKVGDQIHRGYLDGRAAALGSASWTLSPLGTQID
ncbi:LysR substrate-binding domain-containing protein, partial [Pseudomonas aeruginosa]